MKQKFITSLLRLLGEDSVITDAERLETYSKDETPELSALPDVVAIPKNNNEIEKIVQLCYQYCIPITPRGAGTGVVGGAIPVAGGLVISLEKLNNLIEIDRENLVAIVQPGMITGNLQKAVEAEGLYYPPDPASVDSCSIGGNVATSAGGMRAFKYGTTKKFVQSLELVLPPGKLVRLGGKMIKDVAGYDMLSLIVGSEGTLGIITEVMVRLLPKPTIAFDLLAGFASLKQAADAMLSIVPETKVMPSAMEFIEGEVAFMVEDFLEKKIPFSNASAITIVSIDGNDSEQVEKDLFKIGEHLLSKGAIDVLTATNRITSDYMWEVRRCSREAIRHCSPDISAQDVAVPPIKVPELLEGIKFIGKKHNARIVGFGHIGDGNMHIDLLREKMNADEWAIAKEKIVPEILMLAVNLSGTITGEHGIGYTKRKYLSLGGKNFVIEKMKAIKDAIDPQGLMNPKKIFI